MHELVKIIPVNFMYSKQYDTYQTVYSYHLVQGFTRFTFLWFLIFLGNYLIYKISHYILLFVFFSHEIVVDIQYLRINTYNYFSGRGRGRDRFDVYLHMISIPITTNVVSTNPVHDEVYWIQHYVIKIVSGLPQVGGFLRLLRIPPSIK